MSLFGSLFTGVSALGAQSQSVAIISNNIANVNTVGFKRAEAQFSSLVTSESSTSGSYSPGTVATNRIQRVDEQGAVQQTSSATDVSIAGDGFFVVKRAVSADQEFLYTRNGSFSENEDGYLVNSAGMFLYGLQLDASGNLPAAAGDLSSLVPIDVGLVGGSSRATTDIEIAANLNSSFPQLAYPIDSTDTPSFSRTIRIYDSLGNPQDISLELTHSTAPTASATSDAGATFNSSTGFTGDTLVVGNVGTIADGDDFTIAVGGDAPVSIEITSTTTIQDLIDDINAISDVEARLTSSGEIEIRAQQLSEDIVFNDTTNTPAQDFGWASSDPDTASAPTAPTTTYNGSGFSTTPPNTQGWWHLRILNPDDGILDQGYINFEGDGDINATTDTDGEIKVSLTNILWGNGSDAQSFDIQLDELTQLSLGNTTNGGNTISVDQNGAALGLRTGVEVDSDGFVIARFSNGSSSLLYKIPLATFSNPNGLTEVSGTAYAESEGSGEENIVEAGSGGSGTLENSTVENSNVDIADEFARLIITQRAYSAGTKVITTADEITEELLRIR